MPENRDLEDREYGPNEPGVDGDFLDLLEDLEIPELWDSDDRSSDIEFGLNEDPCVRLRNLMLLDAIRRGVTDLYFRLADPKSTYRTGDFVVMERQDRRFYPSSTPPPGYLFDDLMDEFRILFGVVRREDKPVPRLDRLLRLGRRKREPETHIVDTGKYDVWDVPWVRVCFGDKEVGLNFIRSRANGRNSYHVEIFDRDKMPEPLDVSVAAIRPSKGLVLISSPPDSGKTTTAYQLVDGSGAPLLEGIEDPIRSVVLVQQKGAYPTQNTVNFVNPFSLDYGSMLRMLRFYNPEILLFDDVMDQRTAEEVLWYVENGALVYATVPGKDILHSINYFAGLGVDRARVVDSLSGLISQRLMRKNHGKCGGGGCDDCNTTGYKGMVPVYQAANQEVIQGARESLISGKASEGKVKQMSDLISEVRETGVVSDAEVQFHTEF